MSTSYLHVADVAELVGQKERTVGEWVRKYAIPHRKLPGVRAVLFIESEVRAWVENPLCPLEISVGKGGARIVKPKGAR